MAYRSVLAITKSLISRRKSSNRWTSNAIAVVRFIGEVVLFSSENMCIFRMVLHRQIEFRLHFAFQKTDIPLIETAGQIGLKLL